jgi:hypothetical protein
MFPAAVDLECDILRHELPRTGHRTGALILTNRLARRGKCLLFKPGWSQFRETDFATPQDENYILAANPLSLPKTLQGALALAAEHFAPDQHDFVLITKSHGSVLKALTPRLVVRAEETNRGELLQIASPAAEHDRAPDWAGKLGVSKDDYFSIITQAGKRLQMQFSLVYWEACNAFTNDIQQRKLPDNVERLLLIRHDANYVNLLYADILQGMHAEGRLAEALVSNLPPKFALQRRDQGWWLTASDTSHSDDRWVVPRTLYFLPLALAIVWLACNRRPKAASA